MSSSTNKQLALVTPSVGGGLLLQEVEKPGKPGPGKLLLKIVATATNPMDYKMHDYGILVPSFPTILGSDFAGAVEEVGEGVQGWKKGDRLLTANIGGGFQQYTEVDVEAQFPFHVPKTISIEEASTMPIAFATAIIGLYAEGPSGIGLNPTVSWNKPCAGQSAFVISGSSSVGQYAIQLLKFAGFTSIVAYASLRHADLLKSLGATEIIDRNEVALTDLPTHLKPRFNVVFDALSGPDALAAGLQLLADQGKLATVTPPRMVKPETAELFAKGNKRLGSIYGAYKWNAENEALGNALRENFDRLLDEGVIKPNRYEILPGGLKGLIEGTDRHRQGKVSGVKLIARPHETE
ncbi:GroES-like protein [Cylindrobasidium torrendii FP15055 ss-10]|uniref:GroES-like protein n=1 Tax=Cylindrobasidium torrendii FP15055 ss-10 TaxID=1314674 RepID=A0A0D7BHF7_9AGAR|nr:GroES-like protein [Cylindrobasidium torrendii FP15055 ss-10]